MRRLGVLLVLVVLLSGGACSESDTQSGAGLGASAGSAGATADASAEDGSHEGGAAGAGGTGGSAGAAGQAGTAGVAGAAGAAGAAGGGNAIGKGPIISPLLVGQNLWYPSSVASLWPEVKASGVGLVRIGGNGPNKTVPSDQQYLDWIKQIRAIGAEPLVQVSQLVTADQAGKLVTFLNVTSAASVAKTRYWSIGNEPDLDTIAVADVASYVRGLASKMKEADSSVRIFAPDLAWYDEPYVKPLIGGAEDVTGKDANGRYYIDGVTFHTYPNGDTFDRAKAVASAGGIRANAEKLLGVIAAANTKNARAGADALAWGIGEFNMTYKNPANNDVGDYAVRSFLNGQFFVEVFGVGMEHGAEFVATWSVHESSGAGGPLDLGYLDGPLAQAKPRSSYWHLQLVASHFRGRYAAGKTNQPLVKAYGAGAGSELAVMILNQELTKAFHFTLRLSAGGTPSTDPLDIEVDSALDASASGDIDAQATAVLVFDGQATMTKRIDYRLTDAQAWKPPE
jgi:hypothetical protein